MKFELVDFYPITDKNRGRSKKNILGSVHVYIIDCNVDIRGIKVAKKGNRILFLMPHMFSLDLETGQEVRYPIFSFTNPKDHESMMNFLHSEVKTHILERLNSKSKE